MKSRLLSALLVFLLLASASIPAVSAVDATYESLHELCEKHPDKNTRFVLFEKVKIGYSVRYVGHGNDYWSLYADKEPTIKLDLFVNRDSGNGIYERVANFVNDVDYIFMYGNSILSEEYGKALKKHERAIVCLTELKRYVGDYSNPPITNYNINVPPIKIR